MVGLDGYFFLRYILFSMVFCGMLAVPFMAVLIPLHITGGNSTKSASLLELVSSSNIAESMKIRHVAHVVLCAFGTVLALLLFNYELNQYFRIRGRCILSRESIPGTTSTLLIKGLHPKYLEEGNLINFFSGLNQSDSSIVSRVWYNRDYSRLRRMFDSRTRILHKLERQELWLVETCLGTDESHKTHGHNNNKDSAIVGNRWQEFLQFNDLELMRGKKGTMFSWLKGELNRLNSQILITQNQADSLPLNASCFVQFDHKLSCFIASRSLGVGGFRAPGTHVFDKIHPADIIWDNLAVAGYPQLLLHGIATFLNYLFIFGWTFPVALVSMLTQVELMSQWMPQIQWLVHVPQVAGFISNMISPLIVSGLTSQVPTIFRALARMKGFPTNTLVEMDVQKHLFLFMFFQLFVIATLATGLPSLLYKVMLNTSEGAITLAGSLPKASTFFVSYVMASCLTTSGNVLMQSVHLLTHMWLKRTARTPRQKFDAIYRYTKPNWGSLYPLATNVCAIGIAYALISPLILPSCIIGLAALYLAFKYCILYCYVPRCMADGDYYPRAIFQLFSGIYCQQIALLGTLLVSQQPWLAAITVVISIFTGVAHFRLKQRSSDMMARIPLDRDDVDLEAQTHAVSTFSRTQRDRAQYTPHTDAARQFDRESISSENPALTGRTLPSCPPSPCTPGTVHSVASDTTLVDEHGDASHQAGSLTVNLSLFDSLALDYGNLSYAQKSSVLAQLFVHPLRKAPRPCVWIPADIKGVASDQVAEMQNQFTDLRASCQGAEITKDGAILVASAPPDVDLKLP